MAQYYDPTIRALMIEMEGRRNQAMRSLNTLKNQQSEFAQDHRSYLAVLDNVIAVIESHMPQPT